MPRRPIEPMTLGNMPRARRGMSLSEAASADFL
jgi:hypothetical protein